MGGSASRRGLHPGGSESGGVCIQEVCPMRGVQHSGVSTSGGLHPGGSASEGCIQGGLHLRAASYWYAFLFLRL